jgi:hypothetical protein
MEKYLLYVANSTCAQYFCGERRDGTLLFCASKSLAVMLPEYARDVWSQIISDRTGHKPLAESVPVLREPLPEYLTFTVRSERIRPRPAKPAWRLF